MILINSQIHKSTWISSCLLIYVYMWIRKCPMKLLLNYCIIHNDIQEKFLMSLINMKYILAVRITQNHILTALATAKTLTQLVNIISLAHKVFNPLHLVIQVASTKHQSNCFFSFFFFSLLVVSKPLFSYIYFSNLVFLNINSISFCSPHSFVTRRNACVGL